MIRETKVQTYKIDQLCNRCEDGIYRISGEPDTTTSPVLYPHRCEKCGDTELFKKPYPTIVYYPEDHKKAEENE